MLPGQRDHKKIRTKMRRKPKVFHKKPSYPRARSSSALRKRTNRREIIQRIMGRCKYSYVEI